MEMEYSGRHRDVAYTPATEPKTDPQAALRKFTKAIGALSDQRFGVMIANFAWAAGQLMGEPDGDARILGMIEFAARFQAESLGEASDTIEENSGVPIQVALPTRANRETELPSIERILGYEDSVLVGITGVGYAGEYNRHQRVIRGLAVMKDRKGREAYAAVTVTTSGQAFLSPTRFQPDDPGTRTLMDQLYPPKPTSQK